MRLFPLVRICFRSSRAHPLRTFLLIFGIALGVAGVIAIDIAKTSVSKSFELSTAALTARSTHQITGSGFSLPQSLFTQLRTGPGIAASAPVIIQQVRVAELEDRTLSLMGVDPFSEGRFRDIRVSRGDAADNFSSIMTEADGVLLPRSLALEYGLAAESPLTLVFGDRRIRTRIAGLTDDRGTAAGLGGVLFTDIAVAQEMLGMGNRISRIDLKLDGDQEIGAVRALLGPGQVLVETDRQNRAIRGLSRSFEASLTAFSILVLFMGIFLIYNTVSFSVSRRRSLNGTLRALGATRKEIFRAVEAEVLVYALAGSCLGVVLGIAMGKGAVQAVCATVSDMYYTLTVSQTHITAGTLIKGVATGLGAALVSSVVPALNAANTRPVTLMQRSASESGLVRYIPVLAGAGMLAIGAAMMIFMSDAAGVPLVFAGVFMVFIGGSLVAPALILWLTRILSAGLALPDRLGVPGRYVVMAGMALRNIRRSLSRTSVLIASLMVVVSVYIGIDTMTASLRLSIIKWVGGHIGGDIHLESTDELNRSLDKDLPGRILALDGVRDVSAYNIHRAFSSVSGEVHIFSYIRDLSEKEWTWTAPEAGAGDEVAMNTLLEQGWIFVSEIFARANNIVPERDARVVMDTRNGPEQFRIAGVFRDFFMGGGRVVVSRDTMAAYWGHEDITAIQVFVDARDDAARAVQINRLMPQVGALFPDRGMVRIRSGLEIKQSILAVFDNTFLITSALQVLTAIVALTGIINSVMALILERSRELGILRACGAVPGQVRQLVLWECGVSGFMAGLLALPLGGFLSWILVDVVNFRSFGWTYEMQISGATLVQALAFSGLAALAAGIVPALRAGRVKVARALRTE